MEQNDQVLRKKIILIMRIFFRPVRRTAVTTRTCMALQLSRFSHFHKNGDPWNPIPIINPLNRYEKQSGTKVFKRGNHFFYLNSRYFKQT